MACHDGAGNQLSRAHGNVRMWGAGSWHDSTLTQPLVAAVNSGKFAMPDGFWIAGDSAFNASRNIWIKKPLSQFANNPSQEELALSSAICAVRQAAEWSNAAMTRVFARLRVPLMTDPAIRARVLEISVRLHNVRCRLIGRNQVKTVFADTYEGPIDTRLKCIPAYQRALRR